MVAMIPAMVTGTMFCSLFMEQKLIFMKDQYYARLYSSKQNKEMENRRFSRSEEQEGVGRLNMVNAHAFLMKVNRPPIAGQSRKSIWGLRKKLKNRNWSMKIIS